MKATVSTPTDGMTLIVETFGCSGEKEEELARVDIPASEIQEGIRCDFYFGILLAIIPWNSM